MKKIAWFIVLAYLAIIVVLTLPMIVGSFAFPDNWTDIGEAWAVYATPPYWIFVAVLLLCEAGLLLLPVKIENRRPIARRHVLLPIIVAGFLTGALLIGVICSVVEFVQQERAFNSGWIWYSAWSGGLLMWLIWSIVFYRLSQNKEPKSILLQQCKLLVQGGLIGLLVAVPTHIVARCRDYCCAGFYTFIGITFGIAVMLLSFGPGIYFLYAARWRRLHPVAKQDEVEVRE